MRQAADKHLSLFHRLGVTLVLLGLLQVLIPPYLRPVRASLRVMERLRVALATIDLTELSTVLVAASMPMESEPAPDQESDQESHDTESLAEALAWPEGMTDRRSVQRCGLTSPSGSLPPSRPGVQRALAALQRSRSLPILAARSASATSRLCRFTC